MSSTPLCRFFHTENETAIILSIVLMADFQNQKILELALVKLHMYMPTARKFELLKPAGSYQMNI